MGPPRRMHHGWGQVRIDALRIDLHRFGPDPRSDACNSVVGEKPLSVLTLWELGFGGGEGVDAAGEAGFFAGGGAPVDDASLGGAVPGLKGFA